MKAPRTISLPPRASSRFKSITDFLWGPTLGTGGFAVVRRVYCKSTREKFAVKIIKLQELSRGDLEIVENELKIHWSLDSPLVVKLVDAFQERSVLYLVLEYMPRGNLYRFLQKNIFFNKDKMLLLWFKVVKAVQYLHSQRVYMRDIKPENILLGEHGQVKLCDFGWACRLADFKSRRIRGGTFVYMSPENLRGQLQGLASDMWGLGVLLYEMLHSNTPFRMAISARKQLEYIEKGNLRFRENLGEGLRKIVRDLLQMEPLKRPSVTMLMYAQPLREVRRKFQAQGCSFTGFDIFCVEFYMSQGLVPNSKKKRTQHRKPPRPKTLFSQKN